MPAPGEIPPSLARYQRQMLLHGWGRDGQERLSRSHALIVGVGALGCSTADLLARAGVGTLTLVDRDVVEATNLQRQVLFGERDVGLPKAEAAARRLGEVNSAIRVRPVVADFSPRNAERLLGNGAAAPGVQGGAGIPGVDILVDGTDNFETRYLLNDLSVKRGLAYAYAGVVGTRGMQATLVPGSARRRVSTPCLRCIFEDAPEPGSTPTCDTAGVLGPAVAVVTGAQGADVLKVLLGREETLGGTLLEFDLWSNERRRVTLPAPRADCPCCGHARYEYLESERTSDWGVLCGQNAVQLTPAALAALDLDALARRLAAVVGAGEVLRTGFMVRARITPDGAHTPPLELSVFSDGRAIVRGTTRPDAARALYARYVGA